MQIKTDEEQFGMVVERRFINGTPFVCPADIWVGLKRIFDGSYDVPDKIWYKPNSPTVLDLGANVGAFAYYAFATWPLCHVSSYEPNRKLFRILEANYEALWRRTRWDLSHKAIAATSESRYFFDGIDTASATLYGGNLDRSDGYAVECIAAGGLGPADIIKVDIEGAEWDFLDNYKHLASASYLAVEYHFEMADRQRVLDKVVPLGFKLVKEHLEHNSPGELIFVKETRLK